MATVEKIGESIQRISDHERACIGLLEINRSRDNKFARGMLGRLFLEDSENRARQIDMAAYLRGAKNFTARAVDLIEQLPNRYGYLSMYYQTDLGKGKEIDHSGVNFKSIRTSILCGLAGEACLEDVLAHMGSQNAISDLITGPVLVVSSAHTDSHFRAGLLLGIESQEAQFMSLCAVSSAQYVQEIAISDRPIDYPATYIAQDLQGIVDLVASVLIPKPTGD